MVKVYKINNFIVVISVLMEVTEHFLLFFYLIDDFKAN